MNAAQTSVAIVGALAVVGRALFPPWWVVVLRPFEAGSMDQPVFEGYRTLRANVAVELPTRTFGGFRWFASDAPSGEEIAGSQPNYVAAISLQLAVLALAGVAMVVLRG